MREAILLITNTIKALQVNSSATINGIVQFVEAFREKLDFRLNTLLSQAESFKLSKETSLQSQQEALMFVAEALRSATEFAQGLVEKGSRVEVAQGRKVVMERLLNLASTPIELELYEDSVLKFDPVGKEDAYDILQEIGFVSDLQTSAKLSFLEVNGDLGPFPDLKEIDIKITAVLNDETPLAKGGDRFTGSLTINDQPQVPFCFLLFVLCLPNKHLNKNKKQNDPHRLLW